MKIRLLHSILAFLAPLTAIHGHEGHQHHPSAPFVTPWQGEPTPWTNLDFQNDPNHFQFAVVSDRTGGPKDPKFQEAIAKLNLIQPEFVMSVGDLIRGTTATAETNAAEWDEMENWISELEMPFFYVAGNHDIQNKVVPGRVGYEVMRGEWEKRFGRPYYHFRYKDVLFLCLFSNDDVEKSISPEQIDYFLKAIDENEDVRWTLVFLHHPLWLYDHGTRFDIIEDALKGRPYTVFAGHTHTYFHTRRLKQNYYVLSKSGGIEPEFDQGSRFGHFDHVTWVTMKDDGPVLANLRLDGILPHDISTPETVQLGMALWKTAQMRTQVFLDGEDPVNSGIALVSLKNEGPLPVELDARFFHSPHINPTPGAVKRLLQPGEKHAEKILLNPLQPFSTQDQVLLELDSRMTVIHPEYDDLQVQGIQPLLIRNRPYEATTLERAVFVGQKEIALKAPPKGLTLRYTTDGSEPSNASTAYTGPIQITESRTLKTRIFTEDGFASSTAKVELMKIAPDSGLLLDYYERHPQGARFNDMPDFDSMQPTLTFVTDSFDVEAWAKQQDDIAAVFHGTLTPPQNGSYKFTVISDDGFIMYLDDDIVIEDRQKHATRTKIGEPVQLEARPYKFELQYYHDRRTRALEIQVSINGSQPQPIPMSWFSFGQ